MPISATSVSNYAPRLKLAINGAELDPEAAASILSLKIEQEVDKTNSFTLEVQDAFHAGQFKWLESDLFRVGNAVSVSIGYTNQLVKMLEGKIQNINASFHTGCAPTFAVEGSDNGYELLTTPSDTAVFKEKRDSDIVSQIATDAKLDADVDQTGPITGVKTKQGGKSYLEFLRRLAAENNFEFLLSGRRLCFKEQASKKSVATLTWGKDIIRFEPQLNTSGSVTEVLVRGWDASGKKTIEGRAKAGEESAIEPGKRTASQMAKSIFGDVVKVISDRPVSSVEEAQKMARAELNQAGNNLLQASVDTIGIPELAAGAYIDIEGFGAIFSGKYQIIKATHSLGSDGFRSSLSVRRNAV